jgi:hypothetical protein
MKEDIITVKDVVETCLREDRRTRNNDKWLTIRVLQRMGFHIYIPYKELDDIPAFESIRRIRQKLQEQGLYQAELSVKVERGEEKKVMKNINKWF